MLSKPGVALHQIGSFVNIWGPSVGNASQPGLLHKMNKQGNLGHGNGQSTLVGNCKPLSFTLSKMKDHWNFLSSYMICMTYVFKDDDGYSVKNRL